MKVSILTCVLNNERFIEDSIKSFQNQNYLNKEQIIIDGGSTDNTLNVIDREKNSAIKLYSSKDNGIYDAINKGINLADGDIIGILHSDDFYENEEVLSNVVKVFKNTDADLVYGDLVYVSKKKNLKLRYWQAGDFFDNKINKGWMPPHPAVFIKKVVFSKIGNYNTTYKISSDYDFLVRAFINKNINKHYLKKTLIKMRIGGVSNNSISNLFKKITEDFRIIKVNKIGGLLTLFSKNYSKISQLYNR